MGNLALPPRQRPPLGRFFLSRWNRRPADTSPRAMTALPILQKAAAVPRRPRSCAPASAVCVAARARRATCVAVLAANVGGVCCGAPGPFCLLALQSEREARRTKKQDLWLHLGCGPVRPTPGLLAVDHPHDRRLEKNRFSVLLLLSSFVKIQVCVFPAHLQLCILLPQPLKYLGLHGLHPTSLLILSLG